MDDQIVNDSKSIVKLKDYVYFGPTEKGVVFDAGEQRFVLPSSKLLPIVERFVQLLDRGLAEDEIRAQIPEKFRPVFEQIFDALIEHNMLEIIPSDAAEQFQHYQHTPQAEFARHLVSI